MNRPAPETGRTLEAGGVSHPRRRVSDRVDVEQVLAGGGEMGALMRATDWAATALGPVAGWPQSLRTTVSTCLNSRFPILVWWGAEKVKIYNDAYRQILGSKHPGALGAPGREVWPEIWHIIGPMLEGVLERGEATWSENQQLFLERNGFAEETYFTFSYSPIREESGGIGGVFSAISETTGQVLSERRLLTLEDVASNAARATSAEMACLSAAAALAENPNDLPFALIYLLDQDGLRASLRGVTGLVAGGPASPEVIELGSDAALWPLRRAFEAQEAILVEDLQRQLGGRSANTPLGANRAWVLPVTLPGQQSAVAFLVAGLSPRLGFDQRYQRFLELVGNHVGTAIARARSLEDAQRRAEALAEIDRAKTVFFSNVSHEFRTPLTLMLGPTEDLLSGAHGELPPAVRAELELILRNELRLQRLVNALLDFSRIEAGRIAATFAPTELSTFTRDAASYFRSAIERAGLEFSVDCAALDQPIFVDRDMWEQIVMNLVSNAFKFTFEGGIRVALASRADAVELSVRDTGVGVASEDLPRLFERFHRVEGTRARTHEGSGIGLALVQEFARLHGGSLRAESTLGSGSTFTVTIPKGSAHLPPERVVETTARTVAPRSAGLFVEEALRWLPEAPGPSEHRPSTFPPREAALRVEAVRPRILVADDNADMRDHIGRLLAPQFRVETARDGLEALAVARAEPPDLVLTDVMMPGLDGFGLLRALRDDARTSAIPVVMLSARAGEEAKVDGLRAGAEDYLVKPFSARELVARVRTHLELARLRQESRARADELERAVRFSEMFVGILGHDLRNPLSAITTAANLLEMRADSEKITKPVGRILASADRMERMISQLLDFARIRLGRGIPLSCDRVDLYEVSRTIMDEVSPVHRTPIHLESSGDVVGLWDRDRLSQLLSNLVANACQHGTRDTPALIRLDGSQPGAVKIEVKNQGAVPPELLPVLFEPLRQIGDRPEKRDGSSGLGLGLYITQQIALAHRGRLSVDSSAERGTCITLELPRWVTPELHGVFGGGAAGSASARDSAEKAAEAS